MIAISVPFSQVLFSSRMQLSYIYYPLRHFHFWPLSFSFIPTFFHIVKIFFSSFFCCCYFSDNNMFQEKQHECHKGYVSYTHLLCGGGYSRHCGGQFNFIIWGKINEKTFKETTIYCVPCGLKFFGKFLSRIFYDFVVYLNEG